MAASASSAAPPEGVMVFRSKEEWFQLRRLQNVPHSAADVPEWFELYRHGDADDSKDGLDYESYGDDDSEEDEVNGIDAPPLPEDTRAAMYTFTQDRETYTVCLYTAFRKKDMIYLLADAPAGMPVLDDAWVCLPPTKDFETVYAPEYMFITLVHSDKPVVVRIPTGAGGKIMMAPTIPGIFNSAVDVIELPRLPQASSPSAVPPAQAVGFVEALAHLFYAFRHYTTTPFACRVYVRVADVRVAVDIARSDAEYGMVVYTDSPMSFHPAAAKLVDMFRPLAPAPTSASLMFRETTLANIQRAYTDLKTAGLVFSARANWHGLGLSDALAIVAAAEDENIRENRVAHQVLAAMAADQAKLMADLVPAPPKKRRPRPSTKPLPAKPAQPSSAKPAQPSSTKPAQPSSAKPAQPSSAKPAQPSSAKPAAQPHIAVLMDEDDSEKTEDEDDHDHDHDHDPRSSEKRLRAMNETAQLAKLMMKMYV